MTNFGDKERDALPRGNQGKEDRNLAGSSFSSRTEITSPYYYTAAEAKHRRDANQAYEASRQADQSVDYKDRARMVLLRDALRPEGIKLYPANPLHKVILDLLDTPIVQRLKDIKQLSYADYVYKDARHDRFGHVLGSAYLTAEVLQSLRDGASVPRQLEIERWGPAVVAFAMLHDVGHLAPRSHIAQHVWYPGQKDAHEELSKRIVRELSGLRYDLDHCIDKYTTLSSDLVAVMAEDPSNSAVPRWTWQLVTGGGWNTDRGDWVERDSYFCGVKYGNYDLPQIIKNLAISADGDLVIRESGIGPMNSFFNARKDMYVNVYAHNTVLIAARIATLIGQRARELLLEGKLECADATMQQFLESRSIDDLSLPTALNMYESRWEYHLGEWTNSKDTTLRELSLALRRRDMFKHLEGSGETNQVVSATGDTFLTVEPTSLNERILTAALESSGRDPKYFLIKLGGEKAVDLKKDLSKALKVSRNGGRDIMDLADASAEMNALRELGAVLTKPRLAVPVTTWLDIKMH